MALGRTGTNPALPEERPATNKATGDPWPRTNPGGLEAAAGRHRPSG